MTRERHGSRFERGEPRSIREAVENGRLGDGADRGNVEIVGRYLKCRPAEALKIDERVGRNPGGRERPSRARGPAIAQPPLGDLIAEDGLLTSLMVFRFTVRPRGGMGTYL